LEIIVLPAVPFVLPAEPLALHSPINAGFELLKLQPPRFELLDLTKKVFHNRLHQPSHNVDFYRCKFLLKINISDTSLLYKFVHFNQKTFVQFCSNICKKTFDMLDYLVFYDKNDINSCQDQCCSHADKGRTI
jgi:hypothetical protein